MRIFKPTWTEGGQRRESPRWHVGFTDHLGRTQRLPGFTDKGATEALAVKVRQLVNARGANERPGPELREWVERTMPAAIREKLRAWDVLDGRAEAAARPLVDHLADFKAALQAKGNTAGHVELLPARARRVLDGIRARFWSDVSASAVERFLKRLRDGDDEHRGLSRQTSNFHLQAVKQFCRWMVQDGRASESPLAHLKALNVKVDRRHDRRALSADELLRLLRAAQDGPERYGVAGPDRALLYRVAVETGLRRGELESLRARSFQLDGDEPTVTVEAGYSKHRRRDVQPILPELAEALRAQLAGKHPEAPAFIAPARGDSARMLRADLEAARAAWLEEAQDATERAERERGDFLAYRDSAGHVADFHALRHTFISNLVRAGVHPKTAQSLARHGTIGLTMDRYTHTLREQDRAALGALPRLDDGRDELRATGTDGAPCAPLARDDAETGREGAHMAASRYHERGWGGRAVQCAGLENR